MSRPLPPDRKLSISAKLAFLFLLFLVVGGANVAVLVASLKDLEGAARTINVTGSLRWQSQWLELSVHRLTDEGAGSVAEIRSRIEDVDATLDSLTGLGGGVGTFIGGSVLPLAPSVVSRLRGRWDPYRTSLLEALEALEAGEPVVEHVGRLNVHGEHFLRAADAGTAELTDYVGAVEERALTYVYFLAIGDFLVLAGAFVVVRTRIVRPLALLSELAQQLGRGFYDRRADYRSADEIGQLAAVLNEMAERIQLDVRRMEDQIAQIQESRHKLRTLSLVVEQSPNMVVITDAGGAIEYVNPTFTRVTGFAAEEVIGKSPRLWQSGDTPPETYRVMWEAITQGKAWRSEMRNRRKNGEIFRDRTIITPICNDAGRITHFAAVKEDITDRVEIEATLRLHDRAIAECLNGILISEANRTRDNPVIYANPAFLAMTGYACDEVIGRNPRLLLGEDRDQPGVERLRDAVRCGSDLRVVVRNYRKDGSMFWNEVSMACVHDEEGRVTHFVSILNDITERVRYQEQLAYQATHDVLTGLANRSLLFDRLARAIVRAARRRTVAAILFIDLDHFKYVNDSLGHALGDRLVQAVSERLAAFGNETDTVARLGGDEFVVVAELAAEEAAVDLANAVLEVLTGAYRFEAHEIYVTASIGVSLYPRDGTDTETLLKHADAAMYRAKEKGRDRFEFFHRELNRRAEDRLLLESQLRRAIERGELVVFYQPQVDLWSGKVIGAEALIRWQHPERGLLAPGAFIPVAEETGLIVAIGEWVLEEVCRQLRAWSDGGLAVPTVSVNASAKQFRRKDFAELVKRKLEAHGLDPGRLGVEITESVAMDDLELAISTMQALKSSGVMISMDDFGTGYSCLSSLKRFPLSHLKIDRSFVRELNSDADLAAICLATIRLAHSLRLSVIAEGVESEGQLRFLRRHHCDAIQGFYFSPALPAAEFARLVAEGASLAMPEFAGEADRGATDLVGAGDRGWL